MVSDVQTLSPQSSILSSEAETDPSWYQPPKMGMKEMTADASQMIPIEQKSRRLFTDDR